MIIKRFLLLFASLDEKIRFRKFATRQFAASTFDTACKMQVAYRELNYLESKIATKLLESNY